MEVELDSVIGDVPMPESVDGDFRASLATAAQTAGTLARQTVTSQSVTLNHRGPAETASVNSRSSAAMLNRSGQAVGASSNSSDLTSMQTCPTVPVTRELEPSSRQMEALLAGCRRNRCRTDGGTELQLRGVEVKEEPRTDDHDTDLLCGVRVKQEPCSPVNEHVACNDVSSSSVGAVRSRRVEQSAAVASFTSCCMTDTELNGAASDRLAVTGVNGGCDSLPAAADDDGGGGGGGADDVGGDAVGVNMVSCSKSRSRSSETSWLPLSTGESTSVLVSSSSSSSLSDRLVRNTVVTVPEELVPGGDAASRTCCDVPRGSLTSQLQSSSSAGNRFSGCQTMDGKEPSPLGFGPVQRVGSSLVRFSCLSQIDCSLSSAAPCHSTPHSTTVTASLTTLSAGKCEVCTVAADTSSKAVVGTRPMAHVTTYTVSAQPSLLAVSPCNSVTDNTASSSTALTNVVTSSLCSRSTSAISASSSTALTTVVTSSLCSRSTPAITASSSTALTTAVTSSLCSRSTSAITASSFTALSTAVTSSFCVESTSISSHVTTVSSSQNLSQVRLISDRCRDQLRMTCVPPYSRLNTAVAVIKPRPIVPLCAVNSPARSLPHITFLPASISSVAPARQTSVVPVMSVGRPPQRPGVCQTTATATSSSSSPVYFVIGADSKVVVSSGSPRPPVEVVVVPAGTRDPPQRAVSRVLPVVNGRCVMNRRSPGLILGAEAARLSSGSLSSSPRYSPSSHGVVKSCSGGQVSLLRPQSVAVTTKTQSSVEPWRASVKQTSSSASSLNVFATKIGNQTVIVDIGGLSCCSSSSAVVSAAVTSAAKPTKFPVSRPASRQHDTSSASGAGVLQQSSLPFKNIPFAGTVDEELRNCAASPVIRYYVCFHLL